MRIIFSGSKTYRFTALAVVFLIVAGLLSCEKEIDIDVSPGEPQLVVEGAIETGYPPYVFLSTSLSYFSRIDLQSLEDAFIHDAEVWVSDGTNTVQLKEYAVDSGGRANIFVYTIDPGSNIMLGELEKTYKLTIKYNGQTYEAATKIPTPTPLDSVTSVPPLFVRDDNPTARQIKVYFKDPDTLGNHVRYFTKLNNAPYFPGENSVYSDEIINGSQFETILRLGKSPADERDFDSTGVAYPGDTVTLKWCAIDKKVYEFYNTFQFAIGSLGNPFSSPTRLSSNISNNAIGVWAGYGSVYTEVIIK